ncbi:ArnT family glycosyltransferase [Methylobacterium sp. A54F]
MLARAADRLLAFGAASHARACGLLLGLCLLCFLPGLAALQPMDRDEPRFAQASKQMLETGDLVDIRFQGEARHKKPVGIYWAQAASVRLGEALGIPGARTMIALYRLPSLLGATAAVLLAYWAALAFLAPRGALLAAGLFGACLMLAAEAHLAKTDALLCACTTAALGGLARAWLGRGAPLARPVPLVFWLGMALGILVKGPMVPLFAGLCALVLAVRARSGRWLLALRPGLGLALTLLVVAPWFLAIAWKTKGAFYGEAVGGDMLAKVGGAKEKHWGPPGAYALAFFGTFWPGAAFAALSLPFAWASRRSDATGFLLAWIVPAWLLFEAVPTKLPHYVLPLMPAVAILTVLALGAGALDPRARGARARSSKVLALLVPLVPAGLAAGLCAFTWQQDRAVPVLGLAGLALATALAVLAWRAFARGAGEAALAAAVLAGGLASAAVLGLAQRDIPSLKVSPQLAALRERLGCPEPRVASLGYREPSLVFLVGTDLATPAAASEAAAFLRAGGCRLLFVEARDAAAFAQAMAATAGPGPAPRVVGRVEGFNLNGGRRVAITAYAPAEAAPGAETPP